jgi:prepilin-type N-terminal cleavage/methylation domain-containing protein
MWKYFVPLNGIVGLDFDKLLFTATGSLKYSNTTPDLFLLNLSISSTPSPFRFQLKTLGYTLLEIMIVVAIVGLLASISVAAYQHHRERVMASLFISDLRNYVGALEQCVAETGNLNQGSTPGQPSPQFESYIRRGAWDVPTSLGGLWDVDSGVDGVGLAIGVDSFTADMDVLELVDSLYDDGNVNAGSLRLFGASRYYYVLEE